MKRDSLKGDIYRHLVTYRWSYTSIPAKTQDSKENFSDFLQCSSGTISLILCSLLCHSKFSGIVVHCSFMYLPEALNSALPCMNMPVSQEPIQFCLLPGSQLHLILFRCRAFLGTDNLLFSFPSGEN